MRRFLWVFLVGAACQAAPAPVLKVQVDIPESCRVEDTTYNCGYCAFETLGRFHRIRRLEGLAGNHIGAIGGHNGCLETLNMYRVKFQAITCRDFAFLDRYVSNKKVGVAVHGGNHILVMVYFDERYVSVIDSSGMRSLEVQTWPRKKFDNWWSGRAYVIFPDE